MMIDTIYKTAQALANKEQLGYIKPYKFNLYLNNSVIKIFKDTLTDNALHTRRNSQLGEGSDESKFSEKINDLLSYFNSEKVIYKNANNRLSLPDNFSYIHDLYTMDGTKIDKISVEKFNLLRRNNYAKPSMCNPIYHIINNEVKVNPVIEQAEISYLRIPSKSKWTFIKDEETDKHLFNPTAQDFKDVDMPKSLFPEIVIEVCSQIGITIRDMEFVSNANNEYLKDVKSETK